MLIDAIRLCREKADEAKKAAMENDVAMAGLAADQAAFGLLVLEESMREGRYVSLDELREMCREEPKQGSAGTDDDLPDGVSDDDPEKELPHEKRAREEMKNRGYYS